jgi:hypothetical protein
MTTRSGTAAPSGRLAVAQCFQGIQDAIDAVSSDRLNTDELPPGFNGLTERICDLIAPCITELMGRTDMGLQNSEDYISRHRDSSPTSDLVTVNDSHNHRPIAKLQRYNIAGPKVFVASIDFLPDTSIPHLYLPVEWIKPEDFGQYPDHRMVSINGKSAIWFGLGIGRESSTVSHVWVACGS